MPVLSTRAAVALGLGAAPVAACSLIATFEDRPGHDAGADAGPAPPVAAFPLERCPAPIASSPTLPQACDYRDQACSGFADITETYVAKGKSSTAGPALACDPGGLVAYEIVPPAGAEPAPKELRVLGRERIAGGACPAASADPGEERLVVLRLDPQTLTLLEAVPITIEPPPGAPPIPPGDLAFGRSERRLVAAYRGPDPDTGSQKVFVLTTPIDRPPASLEQVPAVWRLHLAARLPAGASFAAERTSGVDDPIAGKVYVSVDALSGAAPVFTFGDELAAEEIPFVSTLTFSDEPAAPGRADLFVRTRTIQTDAGPIVDRVLPGAVARTRADPFVTVISNAVRTKGLTDLRYLFVPDAGPPTGLAEPWYAAAAIFPEQPGPGFGVEPAHVRLEIFSYDGATYAQVRGCDVTADKGCTQTATLAGGSKIIDTTAIPKCSTAVPFVGATATAPPDAKSPLPRLYATCELGAGTAGSGVVTWHRTAGGFGAAIGAGGTALWLVRPGGLELGGGKATLSLGTELAPDKPLAEDGPLGVTFVDGLGWIVTAVEQGTGQLWAERFGCAGLP